MKKILLTAIVALFAVTAASAQDKGNWALGPRMNIYTNTGDAVVGLEKGILKNDPFQILDRNGVGQLIREAVFKGRGTRENLKCGICGEHGGEPSSVEFCHYAGLNYVSCSPFRVPIARLAAAHAALNQK